MKKYITPALLGFLLLALTVFIPITAKAQVSDIGSGGSTSIIGLPSGRSYFQDATSQAQNGTYNNPVGGANLLQENKAALLIVDSPANSSVSIAEPEVSGNNIWWALVLAIAALLSLAGIMVVLVPRGMWQIQTEGDEEELPTLDTMPTEEPEVGVQAEVSTTKVEEPVVIDADAGQPHEFAQEVLQQVGAETQTNKVQVVEIESEEEIDEKTNNKSTKKRKHGGRPAKKSRK
ncbi:MAG: hypothetical protein WCP03_04235 [Candidatus Saccharibacteria bacterium]